MPSILAGCFGGELVVAPAATGPTVVVEVANHSQHEVAVDYEFTSAGSSSVGAILVSACWLESIASSSGGEYRIGVDGNTVVEDNVPGGIEDDQFFVIRLRIDPRGEIEAAPPLVMATQPNVSAAIPGCR